MRPAIALNAQVDIIELRSLVNDGGGARAMREKTYFKPNMANLHGRMGAQIMQSLRSQTVKSDDNIRKVADECKARILAARENQK